MDPARAIHLLALQVRLAEDGHVDDVVGWRIKSRSVLLLAVGADHHLLEQFDGVRYSLGAATSSTPQHYFDAARIAGVMTAVAVLKAAIFEIREGGVQVASPAAEPGEGPTGVFLVHGRDDGRKNEVARVLRALTGEEPTILHEEPNAGLTIIEKFERHAGSQAFAVVLATADDVGSDKGGRTMSPRARQNVVFEMGYFVGALGRPKVAVLHDEGIELPSDYDGVIYIPLDAPGAWKQTLARELNAGGIAADANRLK